MYDVAPPYKLYSELRMDFVMYPVNSVCVFIVIVTRKYVYDLFPTSITFISDKIIQSYVFLKKRDNIVKHEITVILIIDGVSYHLCCCLNGPPLSCNE